MKYMVIWTKNAQDKLAELWLNAVDRKAVEQAANQIDLILTRSPETKGQDFYGDRILTIAPLNVVFNVETQDLRVQVIDVW